MPTTRRITRTAQPRHEITDDQIWHLRKGYTLLSYCRPFYGKMSYPFKNDDHRRQLWNQNKDEIIKKFGKENIRAFSDYELED